MSGRSWTTTFPPFDSSSVQRLAGSAATSAGAISDTGGLGGGNGADLAATSAKARKGNATRRLIIPMLPPLVRPAPITASSAAPVLFQLRAHIGGDGRGHELVDGAAIAGNF